MKTHKLASLGLLAALTGLAAFALTACEGEPPMVPTGHHGPGPADNIVNTTTEPVAPEAPATAAQAGAANAPTGVALCPCACNCAAGAIAQQMDGGAESDGQAPVPVVAAAPKAPERGTIHGNVTTMPKWSAPNAVVYLEDAPIEPTAKMSVTIDNHQMLFTPFVGVIPTGGRIVFHNSDPFPHNVFSPDNEKFNMGMIPGNNARARTFAKPGAYTVLCNLHPGMIGYVLTTPSSYFGKADAKGHFTIKDVPNGTYKATAWAPRVQATTLPVTVKGDDVAIDFDLHR